MQSAFTLTYYPSQTYTVNKMLLTWLPTCKEELQCLQTVISARSGESQLQQIVLDCFLKCMDSFQLRVIFDKKTQLSGLRTLVNGREGFHFVWTTRHVLSSSTCNPSAIWKEAILRHLSKHIENSIHISFSVVDFNKYFGNLRFSKPTASQCIADHLTQFLIHTLY